MSESMSERRLEFMSDRMSESMSDRMSEYMPECQNVCQIAVCRIECQNLCSIEGYNFCQIECPNLCQIPWQKMSWWRSLEVCSCLKKLVSEPVHLPVHHELDPSL